MQPKEPKKPIKPSKIITSILEIVSDVLNYSDEFSLEDLNAEILKIKSEHPTFDGKIYNKKYNSVAYVYKVTINTENLKYLKELAKYEKELIKYKKSLNKYKDDLAKYYKDRLEYLENI